MQRGGLDPRQIPLSGHEQKCLKILKELQSLAAAALVANDSGFEAIAGYEKFIPNPVSLGSVTNRVNGNGSRGVLKYAYLNDFARDVRRVCGNFTRFNWYADQGTTKQRKDIAKLLFKFEITWHEFIKTLDAATPGMFFKTALPELKWCFTAFEDTVKVNISDGANGRKYLMDDFMQPIELYYARGTAEYVEYTSLVAKPISFAEIITKFAEADYATLDDLKDDLNLLVSNCSTYWSQPHREEVGKAFIANAMQLQDAFLRSLNASEAELRARPTPTGPASLMPKLDPVVPIAISLSKGKAKSAGGATLTLSAGSGGAKGKASGASAIGSPGPVMGPAGSGELVGAAEGQGWRERPAWEVAAEAVWRAIAKHPYVDLSKTTAIADFWHPVAMVDPSIAADYLAVIPLPMDLTTLSNDLVAGAIASGQEFVDLLITIFQNAIDYNCNHKDSSYAVHLTQRCQVLRRFAYWLALETMPLEDEEAPVAGKSKAKAVRASTTDSPLIRPAQTAERKAREAILADWFIQDTGQNMYSECSKLLKDLQRGRNKNEQIQISYFQVPVDAPKLADYAAYVRNPTDLSTIKYRLDGTLPGAVVVAQMIDKSVKRYLKYGEFIADLRRCFSNAIKYNGAHLTSDTTGITQLVYEAALMLQERLEGLLASFTVHLCERVDRAKLTNAENQRHAEAARIKREKEEEAAKKFEQQVIEELKATDHVFAADYDLEQKRKLTELQVKEHQLKQQRAMLEANAAVTAASIEDLVQDIAQDDTSTGGAGPTAGAPAAGALLGTGVFGNSSLLRGLHVPPFPGFGLEGKVPSRYAHLVELKKGVRDRAWAYFLAAPGVVTQAIGEAGKGQAENKVALSRRESGVIRITSVSAGMTGTMAAPAVEAGQAKMGEADRDSTAMEMDVEGTAYDAPAVVVGETKGPTRFVLVAPRHKRRRVGAAFASPVSDSD